MEEKTSIILGIIVLICIVILNVMNAMKKERIECYETYIETNKVTTRCEGYFKNLNINK